jgi:peptidyl-prolyl cis-trans isomerase
MKKTILFSLAIAAGTIALTSCGSKTVNKLENTTDSLSYAFGLANGKSLADARQTGMYDELNDLDIDQFLKGFKSTFDATESNKSFELGASQGMQAKRVVKNIEDASNLTIDKAVVLAAYISALKNDTAFLLPAIQAGQILNRIIEDAVQQKEEAELEARANTPETLETLAKGEEFLAAKAQEAGVQKTESGLLYKVIKAGKKGKQLKNGDRVKVNYVGKHIDGTQFDANKDMTFTVGHGTIAGFGEGLALMAPGAKYELYIPANLAYGKRGAGSIPANSALVFEIEVVEVVK